MAQECFLRAFMYLDSFSGRSKLSTWISRIAINAALMKIRTRRRSEFSIGDLVESSWTSCSLEIAGDRRAPDYQHLERELTEILMHRVAQLSPDIFRAVELHYFKEVPARECARVLGIPTSNMKARIFRAKLSLSRALDERFRRRMRSVGRNTLRDLGAGTGIRSISFPAR